MFYVNTFNGMNNVLLLTLTNQKIRHDCSGVFVSTQYLGQWGPIAAE